MGCTGQDIFDGSVSNYSDARWGVVVSGDGVAVVLPEKTAELVKERVGKVRYFAQAAQTPIRLLIPVTYRPTNTWSGGQKARLTSCARSPANGR